MIAADRWPSTAGATTKQEAEPQRDDHFLLQLELRRDRGECLSTTIIVKYGKDLHSPASQTIPCPPSDHETRACKCRDKCDSKRCTCRKWGTQCKRTCPCFREHQPFELFNRDCKNIFSRRSFWADLDAFFGSGWGAIGASACFTKAVERRFRSGDTPRKEFEFEQLEKLLLHDEAAFERWYILERWRRELKGLRKNSDKREVHFWPLFQIGLSKRATNIVDGVKRMYCGIADDEDFLIPTAPLPFYSFCTSQWENAQLMRHCWACDECVEVSMHWHCGVCGQCVGHHGWPCRGCGGISKRLGKKEREEDEARANEEGRFGQNGRAEVEGVGP